MSRTMHTPEALNERGAGSDLESLIQHLTRVPAGKHQIVSCYVRLNARDRAGDAYLIELKDRIKALRDDPVLLGLGHDQRVRLERDLSRILDHLTPPADLPHVPGVAMFACEELGLFSVVALPRVHRTRVILDDTPWITELVDAAGEVEPVLVVILGRAHARFLAVTATESKELSCLTAVSTRGGKFHSDRGDAPGWNEKEYHHRMEQERQRHYKNVVEEIERLLRDGPYHGFILGGPRDHTSALARKLPRQLSPRFLGTTKLNPTAAEVPAIRSAVLEAVKEHDRALLTQELTALDEAVGSGWAVNGPREALQALHARTGPNPVYPVRS